DIRFFGVDADFPGGHSAQVEEIVHDVSEQARIARYSLAARAGFLHSEPPQLHQARPAENRIQRRAQLVAQGLQKFIFQAAAALGFDACATLAVEQGSELLYRLIHWLPTIARAMPRGYPDYTPGPYEPRPCEESQGCQHAVADDRPAPAFQYRN